MAFATFDPALLTDRDTVRFYIGDTGPEFLVDDDTIDALLRLHPGVFCAAAAAGESVAAHWTRQSEGVVEKQVGRLRIRRGGQGRSLQQDYLDYVKTLRQRCADAGLGRTPFFKVL